MGLYISMLFIIAVNIVNVDVIAELLIHGISIQALDYAITVSELENWDLMIKVNQSFQKYFVTWQKKVKPALPNTDGRSWAAFLTSAKAGDYVELESLLNQETKSRIDRMVKAKTLPGK